MKLEQKPVIAYLVIAGFLFYVLHTFLQVVFIVTLPMEEGWAVETEEFDTADGTETVVTEFKDEYEEAKYYHNEQMLDRNKYLIGAEFALGLGLTILLFHFIPKWKAGGVQKDEPDKPISILFLAFGITIIMPLVFSWILPPPVEWFPSYLRELNDTLVNAELERLYGEY
jgi:hypothetical protein